MSISLFWVAAPNRNLNPAPNGVIDGLDDRIGKAHFGEQALRDQTFGMKGQYCV
jgi:hypothetical protein